MIEDPEFLVPGTKEGQPSPAENIRLDAYLAAIMTAREFARLRFEDGIIDGVQRRTELAVTRWIPHSVRSRHWWNVVGRTVSSPECAEIVTSEIPSQALTPDD